MERTYTVPLREGFLKVPRYKRAKKAVTTLREFMVRHMKADTIKIGRHLNEELWKRGIRSPPSKIRVNAVKEENVVKVELYGKKYEEAVKPQEKKEASSLKEKMEEKLGIKPGEKKEGAGKVEKPAEPAKPLAKVPEKAAPKTSPVKPATPVKSTAKPAVKPAPKTAKKAAPVKKVVKKTVKKAKK